MAKTKNQKMKSRKCLKRKLKVKRKTAEATARKGAAVTTSSILLAVIMLLSVLQKDSKNFFAGFAFGFGSVVHSLISPQFGDFMYYALASVIDAFVFIFIISSLSKSFTISCISVSCILSVLFNASGGLIWAFWLEPEIYNLACFTMYGIAIYGLCAGIITRPRHSKSDNFFHHSRWRRDSHDYRIYPLA